MALDFDGAAGYYSLGSQVALDNLAQAAFAVSAWIYPTSTGEGGTGRIATHRNNTVGSSDNGGGWLFFMDGTASLGFQTVSAAPAPLANNRGASNQVTLNAWQHVLLTYDDAGDRKGHIYVGETEISYGTNTAGSAAPGSDASGDLIIGNNGDQTRTFAGRMAEFAVWSRIPSADEIAALAAGYSPALFPRSLVAYMPMVRGAQELRQGVVTASGTHNPQPHPRVIYRVPIWVPVSAGGGTTVPVPSGSLTLTGFIPTVSATDNQTIAVPAGALTLAGFAPTVNVGANQTINVPAGSLTLTGFAPTVNTGENLTVDVPAGSLTLAGFAPTVVQTAHQTISVPLGTLVMAGYAPTVSASGSYTISVPLGALVLTGYAPVVNNSGATVTVTVKLGSWIRYKKITSAVSTLYGLDPTLNTGFFSYSGTNNLILTKLASSAANYLARSSAAKSSGLRYFAFVNTSEAANDGTHIGVIQSSCPLSYPGADASGYGCQINRAAGVGLWNAGAFTALGGSALVGVGDTGMMAVNFTLGYIWYGRNGTWFNSGDPAAGTGPNQTFAPGTTFYAVVSEAYISVRTCYSLSGAPYAPPSGFSYWDA